MLKGIDISYAQRTVDFNALKKAINFVIIRSSYGNGYRDSYFVRNRDEARRVGIPHGFYHYAYPNHNKPEAEANWFCKVIGTPRENEILALDFEESYPDPVGWSKKFLDRVSKNLGGYKPMIYINLALNNAQNWAPVVNANYGLWLARWDYNGNAPAPKTDWAFTPMRQYANNGRVSGVSGNVDMNVFYGDINTFNKYGYHSKPIQEDKMLQLYVEPNKKPAYSLGRDGKKHWWLSMEVVNAAGGAKFNTSNTIGSKPEGKRVTLINSDESIVKTDYKIKLEEENAKLKEKLKDVGVTPEVKSAFGIVWNFLINLYKDIFNK